MYPLFSYSTGIIIQCFLKLLVLPHFCLSVTSPESKLVTQEQATPYIVTISFTEHLLVLAKGK